MTTRLRRGAATITAAKDGDIDLVPKPGQAVNAAGLSVTGRSVPYATKTVLAPSATPTVDSSLGDFFTLTPAENETINATTVGVSGQRLFLKVLTSGVTSYTLTFGTNFKSQGTLATGTTTAKVFMVAFLSDGTTYNETGRTTAM